MKKKIKSSVFYLQNEVGDFEFFEKLIQGMASEHF